MRGMGLRHLPPRDRRTVYGVLRVTAHADEKGDVRVTGVFDADITELLPTSWAAARASARDHDPRINPRLPTPHKGVVSVRHSHLATIRTDNAPRVRFSATLGKKAEVEVELL
jgi:hypothetical protein